MSLETTAQCRVCGCSALQTDEVLHQRRWLLAECDRCHHRWTREIPDGLPGLPGSLRPRSSLRSVRPVEQTRGAEVARAA